MENPAENLRVLRSWLKSLDLIRVGDIYQLILLFLSLLFFRERSTYLDAAHYQMHMFLENGFHFEGGRSAAWFTQILPVLGIKLGFSVRAISLLYSLNFALQPALTWLFITRFARNREAALAFVLFQALSICHLMYWPVSELLQSLYWLFAAWAAWQNTVGWGAGKRFAITALFLFMGLLAYPIFAFFAAFTFFLLFVFEGFNTENLKKYSKLILLSALLYALMYFVFPVKWSRNVEYGEDSFFGVFPAIWKLSGLDYFFLLIRNDHPALIWTAVAGIVISMVQKRFWAAGFFVLLLLAYLCMILAGYPHGESFLISENLFLFFGFLVFLFISKVFNPEWINSAFPSSIVIPTVLILVFVQIYGLQKTIRADWHLDARYAYLRAMKRNLAFLPPEKYLADSRNVPIDMNQIGGRLVMESMFFSAWEEPDSVITSFYDAPDSLIRRMREKENQAYWVPFTPWENYRYREAESFPAKWFRFPDRPFASLNERRNEDESEIRGILSQAADFQLVIRDLPHIIGRRERPMITLDIHNFTGAIIGSSLDSKYPVYLNCRWFQDGKHIPWGDPLIPLITDMRLRYFHPLFLDHPNWQGKFELRVSLVCPALDIRLDFPGFPVRLLP